MAIENITIPENYKSTEDIIQTELKIKFVKDNFEKILSKNLYLTRVSAPLVVNSESGLNDTLNGIERPIQFDMLDLNYSAQIVHSLAKWKRTALKKYNFKINTGLYTDMNAIRRDETLDNIHSIYVDQWDWEKIIDCQDRNILTLQKMVTLIVNSIVETEQLLYKNFKLNIPIVKSDVFFITSQELLDLYPQLNSKQREYEICKKYKTVFIEKIGHKLSNDQPHDNRAPDYDDWQLNGDLIIYYPILDCALEISSMGIRVDSRSMEKQLELSNKLDYKNHPFHKMILNNQLPHTIGGGIGQSRLCMLLMQKAHIGEVQASLWDQADVEYCEKMNVKLL